MLPTATDAFIPPALTFDPEPPKLRLRQVNFFYGAAQALHAVDLDIPGGQVTALIGASGCGKSTLLRTLNRIFELYPDQRATGEVLVGGRNILAHDRDVNLLRAQIGMVFQRPTPFPMSVFDNIVFGVRLFESLPRSEVRDREEWALRKAALWDEVKDKLDQNGTRLSGGQQQRLCIARAVAIRPEILLLDEPASALDPISTEKIEQLILELKRDHTIVVVTHNLQQAHRIADQTALMHLGRLVECDRTEIIFTAPQKQQTRDYVSGRYG